MTDRAEDNKSGSKDAYTDSVMLEIVSTKAAKDVSKEIIEREERRGKRTALVFSVLALAGFSSIAGVISIEMRSSISEAIEKEITKLTPLIQNEVKAAVDTNIGEVKRVLLENETFEDLLELVRALESDENKKGFSNELRDSIMAKIRALANVSRVTGQKRFSLALNVIMRNFTSAGLDLQVDEIDDMLGKVAIRDTRSSLDVADHYGERIIGSAYKIDALQSERQRIKKYLEASRLHGYPEKGLVWELFIEFKRSGYAKDDTVTKLVESISDLRDTDKEVFFKNLEAYSKSENWQRRETKEGRELARLVAALRTEYPVLQKDVQLTNP